MIINIKWYIWKYPVILACITTWLFLCTASILRLCLYESAEELLHYGQEYVLRGHKDCDLWLLYSKQFTPESVKDSLMAVCAHISGEPTGGDADSLIPKQIINQAMFALLLKQEICNPDAKYTTCWTLRIAYRNLAIYFWAYFNVCKKQGWKVLMWTHFSTCGQERKKMWPILLSAL